jgi:hypothetical protein
MGYLFRGRLTAAKAGGFYSRMDCGWAKYKLNFVATAAGTGGECEPGCVVGKPPYNLRWNSVAAWVGLIQRT